jgi:hypothetical protein
VFAGSSVAARAQHDIASSAWYLRLEVLQAPAIGTLRLDEQHDIDEAFEVVMSRPAGLNTALTRGTNIILETWRD